MTNLKQEALKERRYRLRTLVDHAARNTAALYAGYAMSKLK